MNNQRHDYQQTAARENVAAGTEALVDALIKACTSGDGTGGSKVAEARRMLLDSIASLARKQVGEGTLAKEPSIGLLMSMAMRMDHGLAIPGYYDMPMFGASSHSERLLSTIGQMRQLYEEVSGHGFYKPEQENHYKQRFEQCSARHAFSAQLPGPPEKHGA